MDRGVATPSMDVLSFRIVHVSVTLDDGAWNVVFAAEGARGRLDGMVEVVTFAGLYWSA